MATDVGYKRIDVTDTILPPSPIISESINPPISVSFPPPPSSPVVLVNNDVSAGKSKTEQPSGIKGIQLVKVKLKECLYRAQFFSIQKVPSLVDQFMNVEN